MATESDKSYPIRTVAKLTGLTTDLIRAWERRYGVVEPVRGPRGARLYGDADIQRLTLLARAVGQGRSIGDVAHLDGPALTALLAPVSQRKIAADGSASSDLSLILQAIDGLDVLNLERRLAEALLALGSVRFAQELATPLLAEVGRRWADGEMSIAQEHLVSSAMRNLLGALSRSSRDPQAPALLLATPSGERHEIGLLVVAVLAAERGIRVVLLGGDLPADEITDTARKLTVDGVGLSVTAVDNRMEAARSIAAIEQALPARTQIWLGGSDAHHVAALVPNRRSILVQGVDSIHQHLDSLRARIAAP